MEEDKGHVGKQTCFRGLFEKFEFWHLVDLFRKISFFPEFTIRAYIFLKREREMFHKIWGEKVSHQNSKKKKISEIFWGFWALNENLEKTFMIYLNQHSDFKLR